MYSELQVYIYQSHGSYIRYRKNPRVWENCWNDAIFLQFFTKVLPWDMLWYGGICQDMVGYDDMISVVATFLNRKVILRLSHDSTEQRSKPLWHFILLGWWIGTLLMALFFSSMFFLGRKCHPANNQGNQATAQENTQTYTFDHA